MKYLSILGLLLAAAFFTCAGQPESDESYSFRMNSFILGSGVSTVEYTALQPEISASLRGRWIAYNQDNSRYSEIEFDEQGKITEAVYDNSSSRVMAVYQGQYSSQGTSLMISLDSGELFRYFFEINGSRLKLNRMTGSSDTVVPDRVDPQR